MKPDQECKKCEYIWQSRTPDPKRCPRCGKWIKYYGVKKNATKTK